MIAHLRKRADWRRHVSNDRLNAGAMTLEDWATFAWFRISRWRVLQQRPLTLPLDWKRFTAKIHSLHASMGGEQLYRYLWTLTEDFDAVRQQIGGPFSERVELDDLAVAHGLVRSAVTALMSMADAGSRAE